jgi:Polysaccharide deacetylase/Putative peptidoglycan binding domain
MQAPRVQAPRVGPAALLVLLATVLALVVPAAGGFQAAGAVRVARPASRPVLTFGSRGRLVRRVQTLLNRRGYRVPVTGIYGVLTVRQVRRFQVDHGVRNTGQVGPLTWPVLLGGGARTAPAAQAGGVVYLTFDDGPTPAYTPRILGLLARHRARATFFVVGRSAVAYPTLVRREFAAGHGVGNHTFTHASLSGLGGRRLEREVGNTSRAIRRATGAPARCLRPPYGAIDMASARRVGRSAYGSSRGRSTPTTGAASGPGRSPLACSGGSAPVTWC